MNRFIEAFRNLFRIPDLRNRVLFTLALLAVYRIGAHIPTPGINIAELTRLFEQGQGSVLGIFDLFSGGNLRRLTIFALGIMPYITASIILQLMTVVFPYLKKLQKEGAYTEAESTLVDWKKYMESLVGRPYTKFTTKEILQFATDETLGRSLHDIDRMVYARDGSFSPEAFDRLRTFSQEQFTKKTEEVRHG